MKLRIVCKNELQGEHILKCLCSSMDNVTDNNFHCPFVSDFEIQCLDDCHECIKENVEFTYTEYIAKQERQEKMAKLKDRYEKEIYPRSDDKE